MSAPVSISDVSGVREALSILGLETDVRGDVDASTLKAAFRKAVKAERPDQAGGDAERFRRVIAAYRLIQAHQPPRPALSQGPKVIIHHLHQKQSAGRDQHQPENLQPLAQEMSVKSVQRPR